MQLSAWGRQAAPGLLAWLFFRRCPWKSFVLLYCACGPSSLAADWNEVELPLSLFLFHLRRPQIRA